MFEPPRAPIYQVERSDYATKSNHTEPESRPIPSPPEPREARALRRLSTRVVITTLPVRCAHWHVLVHNSRLKALARGAAIAPPR